ncbi:MAG: Cna protein B-type domain containing protein, partial [Hyphomicrobiales bacterium]|nr:Cna protein B-type domain containing protein [Hyphomicrobiales bacterium]
MTDRDEIGLSRREVVKGTGAVAVTLAAATWPASASLAADGQTVTGIVFEDRSHAGRRQAGDKGIAGVLVSNGREIAKTDGEGRYTLPIEDGMVIFVIKP